MSKSQTRSIQTAYGETSIETVECASCEMEVPKGDALPFVIGRYNERHRPGGSKFYDFYGSSKLEGWACSRCQEDGVLAFPHRTPGDVVVEYALAIIAGVLVGLLLATIWVMLL